MIFNTQELEQLRAAQALFARLAEKAAIERDEYKPFEGDGGENGRFHFALDELAGVLDDMAVSVDQLFRDHLPAVEGAEGGPRVTMTADDFYLQYADTMRESA